MKSDQPELVSAYQKFRFHIPHSTMPSTHSAVAAMGVKQPLGIIQVLSVKPTGAQVRVRVEWTASTPLDLHQNDGGLLVKHPQVLGDGTAGTVVEIGPDVKRLAVGDKVFGFTWRSQQEKAHQEYSTAEEWLLAKVMPALVAVESDSQQLSYQTASLSQRQSLCPTTLSQCSIH